MKDSKLAIMLMLAVGLVGTWVYHLYDKTNYTRKRKEVYVKDSLAVAQGVQDSLQKIYTATITGLDTQLVAARNKQGELKGELGTKLSEIYRLRAEIAAILKNNNAKKEDLAMARQKTAELQQLVLELQGKNSTIEEEKQQISAVLDKVNIQVKNLEDGMQQLSQENKVLTEKLTAAAAFVASEVKLIPVAVKNEKETETNNAAKVSKLLVSFSVQNNIADAENADVYVIINQPDGSVMKPDAWESSSALQTNNGEKKIYTRKIRFEYKKGESKKMLFSLSQDDYQKGNYTMQLYHNGYLIAQASKLLN